jgi:hypothetical protein
VGRVAYLCDRRVLALWAINEADNIWIWVDGLGWRKLDPPNATELLIEAARAKADGSLVDLVDAKRGDTHYITEIYVWGPGQPPGGVEVSRRVSECIYGWTAAYRQQGTHIVVRIQLAKDADVVQGDLDAAKDRWKKGIEEKWGYGFACCSEGTATKSSQCSRPCVLTFEVQWVSGNAHHVVAVHKGSGRADMLDWYVTDSGDVGSHEFGHMLGNVDEYADSQCPSRSPVNTGTVMDDNTEVVERLVEPLCQALGENAVPV